jgi:hypothetical protein
MAASRKWRHGEAESGNRKLAGMASGINIAKMAASSKAKKNTERKKK